MIDESSQQGKLAALTLELPSRAATAESLDELFFILTNDLRTLADFDRCFLITHLDGTSRFVSATLQSTLEGKSRLQDALADLADQIAHVDRPLIIAADQATQYSSDQGVPEEALAALHSYGQLARWKYLCCVPLTYDRAVLGHLLMEWFDDNVPDKTVVMALVKLAPIFGSVLAGRWIVDKSPRAADLIHARARKGLQQRRLLRTYVPAAAAAALMFVVVFFIVPWTFWVGGEAVVAPKERHYAFCKIAGLIDKVYVRQGSQVESGQKLAALDGTELALKIRREKRQLEMLSKEMVLLKSRAIDDPSILAKTKTLELKKESVQAELDFLLWQKQFLVITAPVSGAIMTKDVETYVGKRFEGGEPFCEIAELDRLCAEIYVSEDRIIKVRPGQRGYLYLNSAPRDGYALIVEELAPRSEVQGRLGNVYKVSASLIDPPERIKVGMKGVGSIDTGSASLWTILGRRLGERWNQAWLHVW